MWMMKKKHRKPMMDLFRMWRTEGILGLMWKQVRSMGMNVRMAMIWMWMRRKKHCELMMDQSRMWRTESIVLEIVRIGQYISDL
jgi:hypothetical protein